MATTEPFQDQAVLVDHEYQMAAGSMITFS